MTSTTDRPDLGTFEVAFQRVFAAAAAGCEREGKWLPRASGALRAVVELFAAEPVLARTVMVEAVASGPEARRLYEDAVERLARQLDPGRELAAGRQLPEQISPMAVGAVSGLIFKEVLAGRAAELPTRFPDLLFTMLVPYLGPEAAAIEMRGAAAAQRGT